MPVIRGHGLVISKGLAATPNFHPLTAWVRSVSFTLARYRLEMRGDTGAALLGVGYQTADNIDTPGAPVQLGSLSYLGADGVQYGNDWVDLSNALDTASWIRFGGLVKQDSDGALQACTAILRVDLKLV